METKTVKLEEVCEIRRGSSPRPISNFGGGSKSRLTLDIPMIDVKES